MRCGVVVFPGSNCDHDVYHVLKHVLGQDVTFLWHGDDDLRDSELVVLPGGFSYGDYLRAGAMASSSPILDAVRRHAEAGGRVLGICNGFQVLLESGLLPGAMRHNKTLRFECRDVYLRVERDDLPFTQGYESGEVLKMPIAHAEGNYVDGAAGIEALESGARVVFRYVTPDGGDASGDDEHWNVNGSVGAIAGICNEEGNVLGMMPHPERCSEALLGNTDGLRLFAAAVDQLGEIA